MDKWLAEDDQIEAEISMVSSIQKLVGIRNVCGDKENESMYNGEYWVISSLYKNISHAGT